MHYSYKLRSAVLCLLLLPGFSWPTYARAAQTFNLQSTVHYALEHSPVLNSAAREVVISHYDRENTTSLLLPSLDLTAAHGLQNQTSFYSTNSGQQTLVVAPRSNPWVSQLNLGLTENLYDNGNTLTQLSIHKLRETQAELQFKRERDRLCRDIASQFIDFSIAVKAQTVQKEQYFLLKKQYDLILQGYHQGLKTQKDYLRFKSELSRADIDLINVQNSIDRAKNSLKQQIAIPDPDSMENEPDFIPLDIANLSSTELPNNPPSLKDHYDYRIADIQNEINRKSIDLAKRKYYPEISLSSGLSYQASDYLGPGSSATANRQFSWNTLLNFKYNIWDWGIRGRNISIAEERTSIQHNELRGILLATRTEINNLSLSIKQLKKNYELSQELLGMEENGFKFLQTEYRNGRTSYLDLITALKSFSDARLKFANALFELKRAQFNYRYHEGNLYDFEFSK